MSNDRARLIEKAKTLSWFHAIDFDDYVAPGRTSSVPNGTLTPVWQLLGHIDLVGRDCLDIGAADGIVAFTMKRAGARRVVAADGHPFPTFMVARDLLGLDVEYLSDLQDTGLATKLQPASFDVIVMAGLLYHVFSPLAAIAACRRALRPGGLLITETVCVGSPEPILKLNTEMEPPLTEQFTTYLIPSPLALEGMLKLCCFDVLASSANRIPATGAVGRIAHLARAASPDDIADRKPQLIRTHDANAGTPHISFRDLRAEPATSPVPYRGSRGHHQAARKDADWVKLQPRGPIAPAPSSSQPAC
jgi:SAM-dependent methyltransferase